MMSWTWTRCYKQNNYYKYFHYTALTLHYLFGIYILHTKFDPYVHDMPYVQLIAKSVLNFLLKEIHTWWHSINQLTLITLKTCPVLGTYLCLTLSLLSLINQYVMILLHCISYTCIPRNYDHCQGSGCRACGHVTTCVYSELMDFT